MSFAQRIWLLTAVLIATLIGYLVIQSSVQEAESQDRGSSQASKGGPSFSTSNEEEYAPDRLLVKLKENVPSQALDALNRQNNASTNKRIPRTRVSVVKLPSDLPVQAAIKRYEASPDVEYAEPDFILRASQTTTANDTDYPKMYDLNNTGQSGGTPDADIDAPEAWNTNTGDAGTIIAVIDEGADINHPDLKNNIWTNPGETGTDGSGKDKATNGVDDDNNGYVDDLNGWDFYNNDNTVYDPDPVSGSGDEHGTHVSGTIAAEGNNSIGVVGVNWKAKIMPLKFLGPNGGYTSDAVEALNYAVAEGAKISNNSWGGGGNSQALYEAIDKANTAGHLFVVAAGNDASNNDMTPSYPSSYNNSNIISVAATDDKDALAGFSNYGSTSVDLAAPGVGILSTLPGKTYGSYNGTSMATPHVTGAAALIKSNDPSLDDAGIKARLLGSVDKKPGLAGKTATGGRLNAAGAVAGPAPATGDTTAPTVAAVSPLGGATGVARGANVKATFSEAMDPATLNRTTVKLVRAGTTTPVAATVTLGSDGKTVTLNPSASLAGGTKYTVRIEGGGSGAKDKAGNPLAAAKVWSFTTGRR